MLVNYKYIKYKVIQAFIKKEIKLKLLMNGQIFQQTDHNCQSLELRNKEINNALGL